MGYSSIRELVSFALNSDFRLEHLRSDERYKQNLIRAYKERQKDLDSENAVMAYIAEEELKELSSIFEEVYEEPIEDYFSLNKNSSLFM